MEITTSIDQHLDSESPTVRPSHKLNVLVLPWSYGMEITMGINPHLDPSSHRLNVLITYFFFGWNINYLLHVANSEAQEELVFPNLSNCNRDIQIKKKAI